jgi:transcriptional regulator with XRE-family HTH domain
MEQTNTPLELRDVVRQARLDAGLTQAELARRARRSQKWVSRIEAGIVVRPDIEDLRRLADILKLDLEDLIVSTQMTRTRHHARRLLDIPKSELPGEDEMRAEMQEITRSLDFRKLRFALVSLRMIQQANWQDIQSVELS